MLSGECAIAPVSVIEPGQVFANAECNLKSVKTFGFDYDYTIANYREQVLGHMIYKKAAQYLVDEMGYPDGINKLEYDESFAIRGLHYDRQTGYLMKLNQYSRIQHDTAYYGRNRVSYEELQKRFPGFRISDDYIHENVLMIGDLFALPKACLLSDVTQYMLDNQIDFSHAYTFDDVERAIDHVHFNGIFHKEIMDDNWSKNFLDKKRPSLYKALKRWRDAGKRLFLLTNSNYAFVNFGCAQIFREVVQDKSNSIDHWTQIFDVVMVNAQKPAWFEGKKRFRRVHRDTGTLEFQPVEEFKRGEVYTGGSLHEFTRLFGGSSTDIIYMGDNIYSDLRKPRKSGTWRTAAIIKELDAEIQAANSKEFIAALSIVLEIEDLMTRVQRAKHNSVDDATKKQLSDAFVAMKLERDRQRTTLRDAFNHQFGSAFRTYAEASKFFYNIGRYADCYTSDISNFLNYDVDVRLIANRQYFPHEADFGHRMQLSESE